jgi:putative ABC transport system permease protein
MRQSIETWLGPRRFNLGLFAAFALTAVLLALSGVYGLVSYAVSQRRNEIGLRMAIGASERDVERMILWQALTLGVAGAGVGLVLSGAGRSLIRSLVRDVSIDPWIVTATAAFLIVVVVMAAWLPARRAAHIQPALAVRSQ